MAGLILMQPNYPLGPGHPTEREREGTAMTEWWEYVLLMTLSVMVGMFLGVRR